MSLAVAAIAVETAGTDAQGSEAVLKLRLKVGPALHLLLMCDCGGVVEYLCAGSGGHCRQGDVSRDGGSGLCGCASR